MGNRDECAGHGIRPPIERVLGIWRFTRPAGGYHRARSLPGHLLHLVVEGAYALRTNLREYAVRAGDVVYYHETEDVEWLGGRTDVVFYSVGFLAPKLAPLPPERRVFRSNKKLRAAFERLWKAGGTVAEPRRSVAIYAALYAIIEALGWPSDDRTADAEDLGWSGIEKTVRERKLFRPTIDELAKISGMSRASVVRAARKATGKSPGARMREIRMHEARGLLLYSGQNVSQVADYLGYRRMHEFSREFARYFGVPPSSLSKKG